MKKILSLLALFPVALLAQVDYSVIQVNEESGINFTQITTNNDYVCMPEVRRSTKGVNWLSNRILDISVDGNQLAYLLRFVVIPLLIFSLRIFTNKVHQSKELTGKSPVLDFSYSPDGKNFCFSEVNGKMNQIFQTSATNGFVCRQITSGNKDYSPVYSKDMKKIFFARMEIMVPVFGAMISIAISCRYLYQRNESFPAKDDSVILFSALASMQKDVVKYGE